MGYEYQLIYREIFSTIMATHRIIEQMHSLFTTNDLKFICSQKPFFSTKNKASADVYY